MPPTIFLAALQNAHAGDCNGPLILIPTTQKLKPRYPDNTSRFDIPCSILVRRRRIRYSVLNTDFSASGGIIGTAAPTKQGQTRQPIRALKLNYDVHSQRRQACACDSTSPTYSQPHPPVHFQISGPKTNSLCCCPVAFEAPRSRLCCQRIVFSPLCGRCQSKRGCPLATVAHL
jgi:hypothetical protein